MKISLDIDVQQAQKDLEIISEFQELLNSFNRMRNAIMLKELDKKICGDKDIFDESIKGESSGKSSGNTKIEIKEVNSLDDLKEMLKSLFD